MTYQVSHKAGDCSYNLDGNSFDEFAVLDEQGEELCVVRFDYAGDDKHETVTLIDGPNGQAALIPGCMGNHHMIASVVMVIMKHFTEDHSFYCESFEDENGESISHPLQLLPL